MDNSRGLLAVIALAFICLLALFVCTLITMWHRGGVVSESERKMNNILYGDAVVHGESNGKACAKVLKNIPFSAPSSRTQELENCCHEFCKDAPTVYELLGLSRIQARNACKDRCIKISGAIDTQSNIGNLTPNLPSIPLGFLKRK